MTSNILNKKADRLAHELARIDGTSAADAVVSALQETLNRRNRDERPTETARRILEKHGLSFKQDRKPIPIDAYHELDHDLGKT